MGGTGYQIRSRPLPGLQIFIVYCLGRVLHPGGAHWKRQAWTTSHDWFLWSCPVDHGQGRSGPAALGSTVDHCWFPRALPSTISSSLSFSFPFLIVLNIPQLLPLFDVLFNLFFLSILSLLLFLHFREAQAHFLISIGPRTNTLISLSPNFLLQKL